MFGVTKPYGIFDYSGEFSEKIFSNEPGPDSREHDKKEKIGEFVQAILEIRWKRNEASGSVDRNLFAARV